MESKGIPIVSKDFIGARVGIVDKKSSDELAGYRKYLKDLSGLMPLREKYKQYVVLYGYFS